MFFFLSLRCLIYHPYKHQNQKIWLSYEIQTPEPEDLVELRDRLSRLDRELHEENEHLKQLEEQENALRALKQLPPRKHSE